MATQEFEISSLSDYTDFVATECQGGGFHLFRGQREDWPLLPKLARVHSEFDILFTESQMLTDFEKAAYPLIGRSIDDIWELTALAQHHGLATRLLDWSHHAMAALWFAVSQPGREGQPRVVWMYRPDESSLIDPRNTSVAPDQAPVGAVYEPPHITPRITSQGGVFTVTRFDRESGQFEAVNEAPALQGKFSKLYIAPEFAPSIRYNLAISGFHDFSLFPDLDGLARYIEFGFIKGSDER